MALLRPDEAIRTVLTADVYGEGEADRLLGRALAGRGPRRIQPRRRRRAMTSTRARARGPRASRASPTRALRGAGRVRRLPADGDRAQPGAPGRRRASTCCCSTTPTARATRARPSGTAWRRCATAGLTRRIGVAPGPANGFTLDVIDCLERFGDRIDWAMVILNPLEPWPGELCLPRGRRARRQGHHARRRLRRPVPRRRAARPRLRRARPPHVPARRAGSRRAGSAWSGCARSPSATV